MLPESGGPYPLHAPEFEGHELEYVDDCIKTGWVSSVGSYVDRFERDLAAFCGVKRAVAVSNGTASLHISLLACGVKRDDEVLIPDLTFVATANAVTYLGAIPHLVDCESTSLGVDAAALDDYLKEIAALRPEGLINKITGRRISALVPMHTFGHPCDMEALSALCERCHLTLIEDAAEAIGSFYHGRHCGNFGKVAALSFNGNKTITTGGGGAVLTNDEELGALIKHLTTQAKVPHAFRFRHDHIGYNYRMPNLNAALGCAQLEQLERKLTLKRIVAARYERLFRKVAGFSFVKEPPYCKSNYWLNAILLDRSCAELRDDIITALNENGIGSRPVWDLMSSLPMFKDCPRMPCPVAEDISSRLINLPSSPKLANLPEPDGV
ncbi:MAG: LegC family aminotransferase [Succinivibrio sp.]|nr:LegC family aminotransferase [Succinivibrio sp.]